MMNNIIKSILVLLFVLVFAGKNYAQSNNSLYRSELAEVEVKLREGNFPAAINILDQILVKYPTAAEVFYAKGLLLGQVGNLDGAITNVEEAYKIEPLVLYTNYLVELYKSKKDWKKAVEVLTAARAKYPNDTALARELLSILGFTDQLDQALVVYNQEKDKGNHTDTLDVALADVFFYGNKNKEGIALLLPWSGKSTLSSVYGRLGYGYLNEKKAKNAIATLELGVAKSNDASLYLDLADAYKMEGKSKFTFDALEKAFKSTDVQYVHKYRVMLDLLGVENKSLTMDQVQSLANTLVLVHPRIAESHMIKGEILWKRGNTAEAKSMFLTAVGIAPNQIDAWRMLINVDLVMKQVDEAIQHSKEGLNANPGNPALLYFSGLAYLAKEDNASARQLLEAALNNSTNENKYLRSIIYGSLGDLYHKLNMDAASDVAYEEAIKLDSTNAVAMNNLAYYLSLRKLDLEKAADYSMRSIALEPKSSTYQDTYAWVMFQQGNYTEALKWIEKALKNSPVTSVTLIEHYGDILSQLGKTKEALKQWQKALTLADISEKDKLKIQEKIKEKKYVE
ncbi:tetratricopeptide repeat protein [Sphingobacterium rhinopitheci]|uniref:tetratricopeptide repeat protein n=1 Tax=Sphingobacterium rhinopitheci TaxID=2781960 RepID=UPI001F520D73|nr:tetratricopeptide repeat protein [Sphingobacterium rhinopitheci]MCI0922194.1 tetratricopeptide repeat protein [Sphingobacterium rhinopitheci]